MMKSGDLTKENFKKMLALEVEQGGQPDLLVDGDFVNASYLAVGGFTAVIVEGKMDVVILGGNIRELVTYIHP